MFADESETLATSSLAGYLFLETFSNPHAKRRPSGRA